MPRQTTARPRLAAAFIACALGLAGAAQAQAPAAAQGVVTRKQAEEELSKIPVYTVMAEHYPKTYVEVVDVLVNGLNSGRRFNDIIEQMNPVFAKLIGEQLPKANVENTLAALDLTRRQAKAAEGIDPQLCLAVVGLAKADKPVGRALPKPLIDEELTLSAKILSQTALAPEAPPPPLGPEAIKDIALEAYDALADDQLRVAMREVGGDPSKAVTPLQQTAYCEFAIAMLDVVLKKPPIEAAQTYRAFTQVK